jgi:hypothetical protein
MALGHAIGAIRTSGEDPWWQIAGSGAAALAAVTLGLFVYDLLTL